MTDRSRAVTVCLPDEVVEEIARRAATLAAASLNDKTGADPDGYLTAAAAAAYLGVSRRRIHQLTSCRVLEPDGRDGRTPLYLRASLDRYVRTGTSRERGR
ncbi:hypothetical protein DSM112329_00796 [Paraconexibacter sp. AEG42_29]|uniref:Helix-turn-helix domain-containing protein n=1 Tax=Paraconexibacter sp. AEG42_29 TaxID=2997339 RepID=A0AAU7AQW5_9ACTN